MTRILPFFLLTFGWLFSFQAVAQDKYWVYFKDKAGTTFDPYLYFDPAAIQRRLREGLSLMDSTDFPLNTSYVSTLSSEVAEVTGQSRWFNAVACSMFPDQLSVVSGLPFVVSVEPMTQGFETPASWEPEGGIYENDDLLSKLLHTQTSRMNAEYFAEKGIDGKGVRIAVFDAGFDFVPKADQFKHLIDQNQIKATFDFVKDRNFVFSYHSHGTAVLSCIAGINGKYKMGCAKNAEFLLARTEQAMRESRIEEENWVESMEWADKNGAEIVNSSLGYTRQFYFVQDMNGKRSMISRAADMAFEKGMLIVNSAGNEGYNKWEVIASPADAEHVLTVGAIDPWTGFHADFSSFGPTADYRMKPNVSAFGYAAVMYGDKLMTESGTSFASPLVAGFAACVRQLHPEWTVERLYDEIQQSADLYPYFDYAHGYGVPDAKYFVLSDSLKATKKMHIPSQFEICYNEGNSSFMVYSTDSTFDFSESKWKEEMQGYEHWNEKTPYVYYHTADANNHLMYYEVVIPGKKLLAEIPDNFLATDVLRVSFRGEMQEGVVMELRKKK